MRRFARRGLLVAALSLAVAATAHAESAWVLWGTTGDRPSRALDVFETRLECEHQLAEHALLLTAKGWKVEITGRRITAWEDGPQIKTEMICLPDTIDPRGPKGK